eukprot:gene29449-35544_t
MAAWLCVFLLAFGEVTSFQLNHNKGYVVKSELRGTLTSKEGLNDVLTAWKRGFVNCKEELCSEIEGDLPADLSGTLYRNGYGKFTVGKETVVHPFDSDGMITAITFDQGKAFFRNRVVRTTGFLRERRARRILYRGVFGTSKQGFLANFFDLKLKNTANTHVTYWGDKLLAFWEGGLPYRLEADSLRTIGEYRLKGLLKPNQALSAHYKVDPDKNTLVTFSAKQTPPSGIEMTVYELDTNYNVNTSRTFSIKGFGLFHDFAITKNYYIFTRCPLKLDPLPYVLGKKGPAECITFHPDQAAEIYIVPRDPSKPISTVPVDAHFNFHYANAYEEGSPNGITTLHLDVVRCDTMTLGNSDGSRTPIWERIDYTTEVPLSKLVRYSLSQQPAGGWEVSRRELCPLYCDFPIHNPSKVGKQAQYYYIGIGRGETTPTPLQGIAKISLAAAPHPTVESRWMGEQGEFITEASFAPKASSNGAKEDDGYILAISSTPLLEASDKSAGRSDLLVFDAQDLSKGPLCRIPLPTYIPYGLHGTFIPNLTFEFAETKRKFTAFSALDKRQWNEIDGGFSGLGLKYEIY